MSVIPFTRADDIVVRVGDHGPIRGAMFALPASIVLWILLWGIL